MTRSDRRREAPSDCQFTVVDRGGYWCIYGDVDQEGHESFEVERLADAVYLCGLMQFGSDMTWGDLNVSDTIGNTTSSEAHRMFNEWRLN